MSRLYFRIYLYFLLILVAFGAIGTVGWLAYTHDDRRLDRIDALGRLVAESLPEDDAGSRASSNGSPPGSTSTLRSTAPT